jgi:hypothetical protein
MKHKAKTHKATKTRLKLKKTKRGIRVLRDAQRLRDNSHRKNKPSSKRGNRDKDKLEISKVEYKKIRRLLNK